MKILAPNKHSKCPKLGNKTICKARLNPGFGLASEQRPLADFVNREAGGGEMNGWNCSAIPWRGPKDVENDVNAPSRHGTEWHCHPDPLCTNGYRGVQGCRSFGQSGLLYPIYLVRL